MSSPMVSAAGGWLDGAASNDYPGYDKIIRAVEKARDVMKNS